MTGTSFASRRSARWRTLARASALEDPLSLVEIARHQPLAVARVVLVAAAPEDRLSTRLADFRTRRTWRRRSRRWGEPPRRGEGLEHEGRNDLDSHPPELRLDQLDGSLSKGVAGGRIDPQREPARRRRRRSRPARPGNPLARVVAGHARAGSGSGSTPACNSCGCSGRLRCRSAGTPGRCPRRAPGRSRPCRCRRRARGGRASAEAPGGRRLRPGARDVPSRPTASRRRGSRVSAGGRRRCRCPG